VLGRDAVIDHGVSRGGRWLRERRWRIALWIAVLEGIVVAVAPHFTRWTVIAIALPALAFYVLVGRELKSDVARQLSWILAGSQVLALLVAIFAFVVVWLAIAAIAVIAAVALLYLIADRR
jgi:hypothetical protein